ncbi:Relaxase/Mobilisation nuclease domain-containing protein [Pseudobutyrivibrio sp. 49]|uniref:relaxase/mobilization nuclease domain-containing protein n=2 Tax=unclassified Pseudobutyrivibrio TaxID=2638619 RepID=UPI000887985E|nr:relaxase/mobilization nuclease domain-containing protein [Pseudobutyrivibrio sp. 49]SDH69766.1 Relaxase/Mobilisation nuclease domain-containing protein [Pseudobutyrivibrio sp. 49]
MATTRLIPLHLNKGKTMAQCLEDRLAYALNGEKNEQGKYVSCYECDEKNADVEFLLQKKMYHNQVAEIRGNEVIAYQIRQSFKPGEITPEKANELGYELAMNFTKGNYSFVVSTHTDKAHIHNHIIFNSVSIDGKRKFKNFYLSSMVLRKISDCLCLENGLSVIKKPMTHSERKAKGAYPRKTNFKDKRIEFLKDIQNKTFKGKGKGYITWAKRFNAKQMAKTILFLQEREISSYEELCKITDERTEQIDKLRNSMKEHEARLEKNKKMQNAIINYSKNKNCFDAYKASGYSKKYYSEHEAEIIRFEAAREIYKEVGNKDLFNLKNLREEYGTILEIKKSEYREYKKLRKDIYDYYVARKNLEMLYMDEKRRTENERKRENSHLENVL